MRRPGRIRGRLILALILAVAFSDVAPASAASSYDARTTIVNTAIAQLGKPYLWAAAGPDSFDCSGLVQYCYDAAGIYVPHQSGMLWARSDHVSADELVPGDLVFRANVPDSAQPSASDIHHVAIYVGAGQVIEAPSKGLKVRYTSLSTFPFYGRLRAEYWPMGDRSYVQPPLLHGDYDGDGRDDLGFFYGLGGTSAAAYVTTAAAGPYPAYGSWWSNLGGWDWKCSKTVAGDFDDDGKSDIAVLYDYFGSTAKVWVFLSDGRSFFPYPWLESAEGGFSAAGARPVAADFDGDGRDDLGLFCDDGYGGARFLVARSQGASFSAPVRVWSSGPAGWDAASSKVAAGDFTGDGKADLAILSGLRGGGSSLRVLTPSARRWTLQPEWYRSDEWDWDRAKMVAADVNGDRKSDVVMLYDYGESTSKLWSFISSGSGLADVKVYWSSARGGWDWDRAKLGTGDFDRDGRGDVVMLYNTVNGPVRAWTFSSKADGTAGGVTLAWDSAGTVDWNMVK